MLFFTRHLDRQVLVKLLIRDTEFDITTKIVVEGITILLILLQAWLLCLTLLNMYKGFLVLRILTLLILLQLLVAIPGRYRIVLGYTHIHIILIFIILFLILFFFFFQLLVDFECLVCDPVSYVSYCQCHPKGEVDCKKLVAFDLYVLDVIFADLQDLDIKRPRLDEWLKGLGHLIVICCIESA